MKKLIDLDGSETELDTTKGLKSRMKEDDDFLRIYVRGIVAVGSLLAALAAILSLPILLVLAWKLLWWAIQLEI